MVAWMDAREIASLRASAVTVLADTCTIRTPSRTSDGAGGFTTAWSEETDVPCRFAPVSSRAVRPTEAGGVLVTATGWTLLLTHDAAITAGCEALVGGVTYQVLSVEDRTDRVYTRAILGRAD